MNEPTPPIDLDHLAQYTGGDAAIEAEVLGMFVPSATQYIDTMAACGKPEEWRIAAHSLKGVARGVGAFEVAARAEEAEELEAAADVERQRQVALLRQALARVGEFVDALGGG